MVPKTSQALHIVKKIVLHIKIVLLVEALIQGITQEHNLLGILIAVLHIVAHIELHMKKIPHVEVLIQVNIQQHIQVVC